MYQEGSWCCNDSQGLCVCANKRYSESNVDVLTRILGRRQQAQQLVPPASAVSLSSPWLSRVRAVGKRTTHTPHYTGVITYGRGSRYDEKSTNTYMLYWDSEVQPLTTVIVITQFSTPQEVGSGVEAFDDVKNQPERRKVR